MRRAPAFDQIKIRIKLVGTINCQIELRRFIKRCERNAERFSLKAAPLLGYSLWVNDSGSIYRRWGGAEAYANIGGLLMTNFVDFDTDHGHRRDPVGYGKLLESFDAELPRIMARSGP